MKASIFIPTGNRKESIKKVLESLDRQTNKNFEVIVVDYKSTDGTSDVVSGFREKLEIKFIKQREKGLSKAANLALEKASGEIFIRTDDDVIISEKWLQSIEKNFQEDENVGGVTGPTVIPEKYTKNRDLFVFGEKFTKGSIFWKMVGRLYFGFFMENQPYRVCHWFKSGAFSIGSNFPKAMKEKKQIVSNLEACNLAVKTDLLKKIGGFDESYQGVGEYHESDIVFKISKMGFKLIFDPDALLFHCPSRDGFFKDRPSSYSRMENFIVFYLRHIKPNSFSKATRFFSYILFQDCYYIFQFLRTLQASQLGALPASAGGFIRYFILRNANKKNNN